MIDVYGLGFDEGTQTEEERRSLSALSLPAFSLPLSRPPVPGGPSISGSRGARNFSLPTKGAGAKLDPEQVRAFLGLLEEGIVK